MAVEQDSYGNLRRTDAYSALDPTEKGMVGYFLGMALCKLFAARLLRTPWLLHLDVFRDQLQAVTLGRSRPDLVGEDLAGPWHAFECKGRASAPSPTDKSKAKAQAQRLISVGGTPCTLQVGSFAYFRDEILEFYWCDPEPSSSEPIMLRQPSHEWRYYYEPALRISEEATLPELTAERELADVRVEIHPEIRKLLLDRLWLEAKQRAQEMHEALEADGYRIDGIRVSVGDSWLSRFEPRERG